MRAAVLGCGPAGLMAAHACFRQDAEPVIFSIKRKSPIGGAQYLHHRIPGLTNHEPDGTVNFVKYGSERVYARKVYGDEHAVTSWRNYEEGPHKVWNLREAYEKLWTIYSDLILDGPVTDRLLAELPGRYDLVFSTIPRPVLCTNPEHQFRQQEVWIAYYADPIMQNNTIVYDGTHHEAWYRQSLLFGWRSTEWSFKPDNIDTMLVKKPLATDCDCQDRIYKLGRYGRWDKPVLAHHAFFDAENLVKETHALH